MIKSLIGAYRDLTMLHSSGIWTDETLAIHISCWDASEPASIEGDLFHISNTELTELVNGVPMKGVLTKTTMCVKLIKQPNFKMFKMDGPNSTKLLQVVEKMKRPGLRQIRHVQRFQEDI